MSNFRTLGISFFIESLSDSMYMPFLIIFLNQLAGGNLFNAAALFAAYIALRGVLAPLFGWISDKTGRRGLMILGTFGVSYILYQLSLVTQVNQLYVLIPFFAALDALNSIGEALMQDMTKGEKQGSLINYLGIIMSIGGAIGLAIGGQVIELYGFQFAFLIAAVVHAVAALPLFFLKKGEMK